MTTDNEQTTLEPCPKCGDNLALHKWKDAEVSCGRCGFNAPFDVWQSRAVYTRVSADSTAPVVDNDLVDRALVLRELMRINCASSYCVCVPKAVERIRALSAPAAASPAAPVSASIRKEN